MGNDQSTVLDKEREVLENIYHITEGRLDANHEDVNRKVNAGTSAANCQPSHTLKEIEEERLRKLEEEEAERREREIVEAERLAGLLDINDSQHAAYIAAQQLQQQEGSRRRLDSQGSSQRQQQSQQQPEKGSIGSYVQMAKMGYQELVNAIIRPPRANYREEHLGPPAFSFLGKRFTRTDFTLQTKRGLNLQCSHWEPVERSVERIPVVIYMHGNASARVEVLPQLTCLLALGVAVFAFDFAGSGKSDGEHVSLGYYEREDLMCVVAHLRATDVVSTIALWGRSMGAVTALMHGDRDPSIAGMVLDSPFADLSRLCEEMVDKARDQGINVPGFVSSVAIRMIRGSVRRQADFDIKDVSPISHVEHCFIPALFVAAENDDFIPKAHSMSLYDVYAGDANMIVVDGDHNSNRPRFMFDSVSIFLQAALQIPPDWQLRVHPSMNISSPPWRYPGATVAQRGRTSSASSTDRQHPTMTMHSMTSPTRQAALPKESDDIDAEEETAAAIAAGLEFDDGNDANINVETLGMTSERQREIQGSLFRMLGHEGDEGNSGAALPSENSAVAMNGEGNHQYDDDSSEEEDVLVNLSD
ncbi:hypothetical protein THAPSDRAFT_269163 [Thalassiosira pseudonana CCMP1335]|uniref:Serine aminopeptidase S33 domain-containing protein n=1 Tax=Thalassiosira pseudonana TaxID=35128 RepID=B8C4B4_THAPS|nr:hypothetical protein THAPSDRAFT_269163 [Thalassiosira pseudonana CCMP1335]EED91297.1 hypothetical protein THAPSDRAFT_269163 [Thalassiosira pseudonana CCMP1335]